jgi:hypothetical protein
MKRLLKFSLLFLGCLAMATQEGFGQSKPEPAAPLTPTDPAYLPLGVYWPGEYLFSTKDGAIDWPRNEAALDDLAKHHVNAIWLTHRSAAETAEFSRRAAKRGIYLVASLAELAGDVEQVRKSDHAALIQRTLRAWGDAPKPIAWGLGDEPRTAYMNEMAAYAQAWKRQAPKEPITTVVMHQDVDAGSKAGFDFLCADIYPFFSGGNPNSYGLPDWYAWILNVRKLRQVAPRPWMMGQSYQEPWGPYDISKEGNIVYLPGGAPHWVMPSPAQMSWQAYAAVAEGGKGMFYFLYRWPMQPNLKAGPTKLPAAVKERTDSGSPRALVHEDGRSTPQYEAVGQAFGWIRRHAATLAPLQPAANAEVWEDSPRGGNVVSLLVHPKTAARYLMVVSHFGDTDSVTVNVKLGPHIIGLNDMDTGRPLAVATEEKLRKTAVTLKPGTAALFECRVDRNSHPSAYGDDFATDKFAKDALKVQSVKRHGVGVLSASGHENYKQAFVIYDLDKLLPALPKGGSRMLIYESSALPADFRGAFWSVSDDGQKFTKLSHNEPGKPVFFRERYLKVGLSWKQSSVPSVYGCLKRFNVMQWGPVASSP